MGAGPAGLGAAAMLRASGVSVTVLERTDRLAAPWHGHYDAVRLQSPKGMSNLPGMRYKRHASRWITRDEFLEYLADYRDRFDIDIRFDTEVRRVTRCGDGWRIETDRGDWHVPVVVVATGYSRIPKIPEWPGLAEYTGTVVHSSQFRNADGYRGTDVLVVGTGNSGGEIAALVAGGGARRTRIAVRTAPHIAPRTILGVPTLLGPVLVEPFPPKVGDLALGAAIRVVVGDLAKYGMPKPANGICSQYAETGVTPIIDAGILAGLRTGAIEPVAHVVGFRGNEVLLADGTAVSPDLVIAATGYHTGLPEMLGDLDVLRSNGFPVAGGGTSLPQAPGLYFLGYAHPLSGNIRSVRRDAPRLAKAVTTYLSGRSAAIEETSWEPTTS
ncbi:flavin-containing monooxygenase [Nocardia sp. JMUB6875]|uniref:flavin-containing monooxygenase n=1 Tax=Nocardia sp. JMUB6875 TaxID=3158170 RepID=UPI0034E8527E